MDGGFVRPASVPKRVWSRYSTFRIEDIPDERRDEAISHMIAHFFEDEPTSQVLKKTTPYSDSDIRRFLNNALNDNISLCAIDEANGDKIVGVTILRVASRTAAHRHDHVDQSLTSMKRLFVFLEHCHKDVDTFTYEKDSTKVTVDHVLEPMGLSVSPEYRGKGIGQALIKARHAMSFEVGIGATMGIYTSIYSQAIILRQGMKTIKEVSYTEYTENGVVIFAELDPPHPSAKLIGGLLPVEKA